MRKFGLLSCSALRSTALLGIVFGVSAPALAQSPAAPQPGVAQRPECDPNSPSYNPNSSECSQPAEGAPGETAPGSNAGTTPSDEEPTQLELDPNAPESETILVTGSRIPRPQFEGTIPGAQVTAEQIEARAFTNTLDVLNDIPLVGPGASPFGNAGGQPASLGAAFVDLLDLGTNRTLTLVNGRRYVSGNAATLFVAGNVTGSQVDLNTIPAGLISRLDVLTVGGAVAYGSDAIAGVVNVILRDDYQGVEISGLSSITEQGDGANYRGRFIAGTNFADDRGNVAVSFEANRDDPLIGTDRRGIALNLIAPTSFRNGAVRNSAFGPTLALDGTNGAFLPAATDLVPNNIAGTGFPGGSIILSNNGAIFQANANINNPAFFPTGFQGIATVSPQDPVNAPSFRPAVLINQAGNVNLVPGTPIGVGNGCVVTNLTNFCNFAPNALPGAGAAQATFANAVVARFAPTFTTQGTQAQRNALALQLLQANRPTPREFLIANPNTNINAFIGSTIPNFLDVPNRDPATAAILPQVAVPLQFDAAGNVIQITSAIISDPRVTPSTTGGATTPDGLNQARFTNLRVQQNRYIANLIGHYDVADWLTVYTENQFARVENLSPTNIASSNTIGAATAENATLVLNINNPFLDAQDRSALSAAGVTGPFVLSRTNQDIVGDNPARVSSDTYRSVVGLKGDFGLFGRDLNYDVSFTYGRADSEGQSFQIKDIEYALAINATRNAAGQIVCASQLNPAAIVGTTPQGVNGLELVRNADANGLIVESFLRRTVTAEQVAGCQPLNVFGFNQFSEAAREYVLARTGFSNKSEQIFTQATIAGSFFDLPGGPLGFAVAGEYRRDDLSYRPDELSRTGATRTAALAATSGYIENYEIGGELRIPIFGEDFNIPLFRNLEFTPGIRFVRQDGDAPDVQLLSGTVLTNESRGDWNEIYSLAGSWRPIRDITLRGNYTRSIRQPSIVELFLGGQPAFSGVADPCSSGNIGVGIRPAVRRANCQAAVVAAGIAGDAASAAAFLNTYVPSGAGISGTFAGSPDLLPERGKSYTFGGALTPRFLPGLTLSADYINVEVRNQIIPTAIGTALQVCYDSPAFPDTSPEVGVNVCSFFNRIPGTAADRRFEVDNGFNSGFINLGALKVEAVNITGSFKVPLTDWFGIPGNFEIFGNAYHLINYINSSAGDFSDAQNLEGSFNRAKLETQLRGRYENSGFSAQWTWNWQEDTRVFLGGAPIPGTNDQNETQDLIENPSFSLHDATIGYSFGEERRFGVQFTVRNIFDKQFAGEFSRIFGLAALTTGRVDDFGRRFVVQANIKF